MVKFIFYFISFFSCLLKTQNNYYQRGMVCFISTSFHEILLLAFLVLDEDSKSLLQKRSQTAHFRFEPGQTLCHQKANWLPSASQVINVVIVVLKRGIHPEDKMFSNQSSFAGSLPSFPSFRCSSTRILP